MKRATSTLRRIVLQLLICLLLAVVVTVAVAWALAAFIDMTQAAAGASVRRVFREEDGRPVRRWSGVCLTRNGSSRWIAIKGTRVGAGDTPSRFPASLGLILERVERMKPDDPTKPDFVLWDARGWPMHALSCRWTQRHPGPDEFLVGGIGLPPWRATPQGISEGERRALPLVPLWAGFTVDTALYCGVLWLVLFAPSEMRRAVRRWRGGCSKCGYDPRGLPDDSICPECGSLPAG